MWGAGLPSNTMSPMPRPTFLPYGILIHPAIWQQQTSAENCGSKPLLGGAGSPSNTMWPGPRSASMAVPLLLGGGAQSVKVHSTDAQNVFCRRA